jgi:GNAT superfamily N-acetyltransferase
MLHIGTATADDIPQLLLLINAAYRGEASRKGWTTEADFLLGELRTDAENLRTLLDRKTAVILKYCDAPGGLTGCVFLDKHGDRLYLGMLSVYPEKQAGGIGKQLLLASEAHARHTGCRAIYMRVLSKRAELIAWYERHGYYQTGNTQPYDGPPQFGTPTEPLVFLIMEKTLTAPGSRPD